MTNNVIQRNIMLVGSIKSIEKILNEKKNGINIYKCCIIKSANEDEKEQARNILKIPVFTEAAEMRLILEYHELGQIWILDDNKDKNLITGLIPKEIESLVKTKVLSGGMLPKIQAALIAAENKVNSVHIIDGRVEHALLLEILTDQGVGTLIKAN
jgi:acetylglutamate kinase